MKITVKLPMSDELKRELLRMPPEAAGTALQAALRYFDGEGPEALNPASQAAYSAWRKLVDTSRKRAAAGKAGGRAGGHNTRFAHETRFAPSKMNLPQAKQQKPPEEGTREQNGEFDEAMLDALAAFL